MRIAVLAALILVSAEPCVAQNQPKLVADAGRTVRDSRGGGGRAFTIDSRILKEKRRINVAFPASYNPSGAGRHFPVTIVLDGEASLPDAAAASEALTRNGQIPEAVIVAIENTDRLRDLTPPGLSVSGSSIHEGGDRFLDFIEQELMPELDRLFHAGAPYTFIGHSSGGILVTYAAATRPVYRSIIALDTPTHLGQNWLVTKLVEYAKTAKQPLRYSSYESRFGWTDATWKTLSEAAPSSWMLHREKLSMENHESMPMLGMYLGLRNNFSDYSMIAAPTSPTTQILPYYAKLNASLGAPVVPPKKLLVDVVDDLLMEGRGAAAREAYDMEVAAYGKPANAADLAQQIARVEKEPAPTETVEGLLATAFPTPAVAASIIGEYTGNIYMNVDELGNKPPETLRIWVADGKVHGESTSEPAPGDHMVRPWTYLTITPQGFSYGYMNGMRPRGMLIHDGTFKNGVVSGKMRFGGVNFKFPDGMTPPEIRFLFKKVK